ncbi:MAG: TVP38/TMEM64 family protein [Prochloron sp. SP5CPC1]|nr:TVP38/TMEM64 family protein [Candidatus Paraprochloron terpiosi SP5CPC1]
MEYLRANPCCVTIPFILVYAVVTVIGVPGTILTIAGGLVFGLGWGSLWSVIGATLGAMGSFWAARYLAVRFAPISPFNVVNFLFGLTPIHWVPYSLGTFIGIIPGTLAYTWLGTSGSEALAGGERLPFILALGFLTLLSIIPFLARKKQHSAS